MLVHIYLGYSDNRWQDGISSTDLELVIIHLIYELSFSGIKWSVSFLPLFGSRLTLEFITCFPSLSSASYRFIKCYLSSFNVRAYYILTHEDLFQTVLCIDYNVNIMIYTTACCCGTTDNKYVSHSDVILITILIYTTAYL